MSQLLFYCEDNDLMSGFYMDIVSSSIFQNQISYLEKYTHTILSNYSIVVYLENLIKDIIKQIIISNLQKLNDIKQTISNHIQHLNEDHQHLNQQHMIKIINAFGQAIFNRLEQIKTVYLLQSISLGSLYLMDVNWKITKTISSSSKSFIGQKYPYLFTLSLFLKQRSQQCQQEGRQITLQMNKIQLKQFLTQLKNIKAQMN